MQEVYCNLLGADLRLWLRSQLLFGLAQAEMTQKSPPRIGEDYNRQKQPELEEVPILHAILTLSNNRQVRPLHQSVRCPTAAYATLRWIDLSLQLCVSTSPYKPKPCSTPANSGSVHDNDAPEVEWMNAGCDDRIQKNKR